MRRSTLAVLVLLAVSAYCSVPMEQEFNRDFVTGYKYVYAQNPPYVLDDFYYTNPLLKTMSSISAVYYTTRTVHACIYSAASPLNNSFTLLQYSFQAYNWSQTQLTTKVTGYLQSPLFDYLTYIYIIVLANNKLFPQYASISRVTFQWNMGGTDADTVYAPLPNVYSSTGSINVMAFLSDLKVEYLTSSSSTYFYRFTLLVSPSFVNSTTVSLALTVQPYFKFAGNSFKVRYTVICYDLPTIQLNLPRYTFESFYGTYVFGVTSQHFYPTTNTSHPYSTIVMGLSQLSFLNNREDSFYFYQYSYDNNAYGYFYGNYITFSFTAWFTDYQDCQGHLLTLNSSDSLCYPTACPSYAYLNTTDGSCLNCSSLCLSCYSSTECIACDPTANRVLEGTSCVPQPGFYETNNATADPCTAPCENCLSASTNCTSCLSPYILVGNSCRLCSVLFGNCALCRAAACLTCSSPFVLFNSTYCSSASCASQRCQYCSNSDSSYCIACLSYYVLRGGYCSPICGDGRLDDDEECDDKNLLSHDGCNERCQIQVDYFCINMTHFLGYNYTAYCSFTGTISLSFLTLEKLVGANKLRVVAAVDRTEERFWEEYQDFSPYLKLNVSYRDMEAKFVSEWSFSSSRLLLGEGGGRLLQNSNRTGSYSLGQLVQVTFAYPSQIQGHAKLTLDFSSSRDRRVSSIPPSSTSFLADPDNFQKTLPYSAETYAQESLIRSALLFIAVAYLAFYLVSWVAGNKRIMAEGLVVAQLAFIGVVACGRLSPNQAAVTELKHVCNPYNILESSSFRPFDDPLLPNRLRGTSLYSSFPYNLNTGLIWAVAPLLLGLILFLIALCLKEPTKGKVSSVSNALLTEYAFAGLIIVGPIAVCAAVLEITFGKDGSDGAMGLALCAVVLVLLCAYAVLWMGWSQRFGEFKEALLKESRFGVLFQLLYYLLGPVGAGVHYLFYDSKYSTAVVMGYASVLFAVLLIVGVFAKVRDQVRVQANLLCVLFTQLPFLMAQFKPSSSLSTSNLELLPAMIPMALLLNLLVNVSFLTYLTVKRIGVALRDSGKEAGEGAKAKAKAGEEKVDYSSVEYKSQRNEEAHKLLNESLKVPLQTTQAQHYKTRFIEKDQEEPADPKQQAFKKNLNDFLWHEFEKPLGKEKENSDENMVGKGSKKSPRRLKYTPHDYIVQQQYEAIGEL